MSPDRSSQWMAAGWPAMVTFEALRFQSNNQHVQSSLFPPHYRTANFRQSDCRLAHVPVLRQRRLRRRLAPKASGHAGRLWSWPGDGRGNRSGTSRSHHPWMPWTLLTCQRVGAFANRGFLPVCGRVQTRCSAQPRGPKGVLPPPLDRRRCAAAVRGWSGKGWRRGLRLLPSAGGAAGSPLACCN